MKQRMLNEPKKLGALLTALFVVTALLLNVLVYALATRFSWYFYTATQYTHEIGDVMAEKIGAAEHKVTIRFCTSEESMEKDSVYGLVYNTALQYAARYPDKIEVLDSYNVYTDHRAIAAYVEKTGVSGISESSVIVESAVECRIFDLSDFFLLNAETNYIDAYNGEEMFAAAFFWVQEKAEDHPAAYFTVDHGENVTTSGLVVLLTMAGYACDTIALSSEAIPEDCALLVTVNPIYDLEKAKEGSGITAEYDRLVRYLENGGQFYLSVDPSGESFASLHNLHALCAAYGITVEAPQLYDFTNSLTRNGKTFVTSLATESVPDFAARFARYSDARILVRDVAALKLTATEKTESVLPLLYTAETAEDGEGNTGVYTVSALSKLKNGGTLFLAAGGYMAAGDVTNTPFYGNEAFLYAALEEMGCETAPAGTVILEVENEALRDLTNGEADRVFVLLVAVLPAILVAISVAVVIRRKRR